MTGRRRLRKALQRALRRILYAAFRGMAAAFAALGPAASRRIGIAIGGLAGWVLPYERRVAAQGLARAFPEQPAAARAAIRAGMFRHLGETAVELLFPERVLAHDLTVHGVEHVRTALAAGRGAVVVTGHIGNWELMAAAVARQGFPVTVVARRLFDDRFDAWMRQWRTRYGIHTLVRDEPGAIKTMLRALKEGHLLGILIDQDTGVPSQWVPFFGHLAKTPDAPARLAARGIPLLVAADRRVGPWRHEATILPVVTGADDAATLTTLSDGLAAFIRSAPEQWVWLHPRWKSPAPTAT